MAIRYAILGLLEEQPMHGYRLKRLFDARVSPLWGLTTGQVYQSLAALERIALVESRMVRNGRRPARRVYSITPSGRRDLREWLNAPATSMRPFREETVIRLLLLGGAPRERLSKALETRMEVAHELMGRIARLREHGRSNAQPLDLSAVFLESMKHHLEADLKSVELFRDQIAVHSKQAAGEGKGTSD